MSVKKKKMEKNSGIAPSLFRVTYNYVPTSLKKLSERYHWLRSNHFHLPSRANNIQYHHVHVSRISKQSEQNCGTGFFGGLNSTSTAKKQKLFSKTKIVSHYPYIHPFKIWTRKAKKLHLQKATRVKRIHWGHLVT